MRIIKSINTANLSTVSIQGDLLTTAAIACFNRLKAKCSYCICQTRQEKTCSFSVRKVEVSMGAPSIFLIPPSLKALNTIRNFPVHAQILLLGEKQSHLHTARSKYVNNASNYSNDFCHSWGSWAGNICIFFSKYSSGSQNAELQHVLEPKPARRSSELLGHLSAP